MKAVALLSGGLDSMVAIRLMLEQGIEVSAYNLTTVFCCCTPKDSSCSAARSAVRQLGIDLKVENATDEFLRIVENPPHGYGRGMNPCIDCRIMMLKRARRYMDEIGASFAVTGEVLGQRPMSQRLQAMQLIERESGLRGLIVRPLSATLLEPTVPETEGWVDRRRLLAIQGRSRGTQMLLADEFGLKDYPCPAGGCLLTDPIFAVRLRDLLEHAGHLSREDVTLLKVGRHFRLGRSAKAVVGRDEAENAKLVALALLGDAVLRADGVPGPTTLVRGDADVDQLELAAAMTVRYGKGRELPRVPVVCERRGRETTFTLDVAPMADSELRGLRIG
ncbi:MAG: hypothetical protein ABIG03_02435 [Candidatus Eisenbacteria bacterium]